MDKPNGLYPNYLNPNTGRWGMRKLILTLLLSLIFCNHRAANPTIITGRLQFFICAPELLSGSSIPGLITPISRKSVLPADFLNFFSRSEKSLSVQSN